MSDQETAGVISRAGTFHIAGDESSAQPGVLTYGPGMRPQVRSDGIIVPWLRRTTLASGVVQTTPLDSSQAYTVLGELDDHSQITLLNTRFTHVSGSPEGGQQTLGSDRLIIGGHVTQPTPVFNSVRLSVQGMTALEAWSDGVDSMQTDLKDGSRLSLVKTDQGMLLERRGQATSLMVLDRGFVTPLMSLISILTASQSRLVTLNVQRAEGAPWLEVWSADHAVEDSRIIRELGRVAGFRFEYLVRWLESVEQLGPLPAVVAARRDETIQLDSRILELSTAAEGLHRRLYPKAESMTDDQASTVRSVVRQAIVSQPRTVSERVNGLLNHVGEPGYKARLVDLATAADAAVPGIAGAITAWAKAVYNARNEYAHRHEERWLDEVAIDVHLVVCLSLQWVLDVVLLQCAGMTDAEIAQKYATDATFNYLCRQATGWAPKIYGTPS